MSALLQSKAMITILFFLSVSLLSQRCLAENNEGVRFELDKRAADRDEAKEGRKKGQPDTLFQFRKGLAMFEQNKNAEAIKIFTDLTIKHPDFPEPFNNLGVLFATIGQYDKARQALETAIRLDPKYSTAYENLGDVFIHLATRAYSAAGTQVGDHPGLAEKLKSSRAIIELESGSDDAKTRESTISIQSQSPIVTIEGERPDAGGKRLMSDGGSDGNEISKKAALDALGSWADAWRTRDIERYLAAYASTFHPAGNESREQWEQRRRKNILGKRHIELDIRQPVVVSNKDKATIDFLQIYKANGVYEKNRKRIVLISDDAQWKIVEESVK